MTALKNEGFQRRCGVYNRQISVGLFLKKSFKTLPRLLSNCKKTITLFFMVFMPSWCV
jgi:hypothetical protein